MPHIDIPGSSSFGSFGAGEFQNPDAVLADAIDELDGEVNALDRRESGQMQLSPVLSSAGPPSPSSPGAPPPMSVMSNLPPVIGGAMPPGPQTGYQAPPGGRPPGYDVGGTHPGPGSSSKAAGALLTSLAVGGALGVYLKDPKAAALGFLGTGSAFNLMHAQGMSRSPVPEVKAEGTFTTCAAVVGLGIAAYFGYGLYKDKEKKRA